MKEHGQIILKRIKEKSENLGEKTSEQKFVSMDGAECIL